MHDFDLVQLNQFAQATKAAVLSQPWEMIVRGRNIRHNRGLADTQ
jgi:hypothetical protein